MRTSEQSVLHVLPHPGGGGETYADLLSTMTGYRFSRIYLAPNPTPSLQELARGVVNAHLRARRINLLHVHGEVASGLCIALLVTHPSVVTLHGLHLVRRLRGLRRMTAALSLRGVLRAANRTISVSEAEHAELVRVVGRAAARRAVIVRNGVRLPAPVSEADRTAVREELGISQGQPVGIWVGYLDERKDPLTAVRAAERASVALLVVGDGPLRGQVERAAKRAVRPLGHRSDVPRLLTAADFFVLSSHREGLSFGLIEAMAHGLPAVVTDLDENIEAIGDAGIPVARGNEADFAAAFRRLAENESERFVLGERARGRVAEFFNAEEMILRTREVYDELVEESRQVSAKAHGP